MGPITTTPTMTVPSRACKVACAPGRAIVTRPSIRNGYWPAAQPQITATTAAAAVTRAAGVPASAQERERSEARDRGAHQDGEGAAGEVCEEAGRIGVQHHESDGGHDSGDHSGRDRPPPEVGGEIVETLTIGVGTEVDRGEERADHARQHTPEHRRGVHPAVHERPTAGRRHPTRRHPADHAAEKERREHRRRREGRAEQPLRSRASPTPCGTRTPEPRRMIPTAARVSGTASVDMIGANARRKRGPHHDEHEDEPHVVRLPHRPRPNARSARGAPRRAPSAPANRSQNPPPKSAPASNAYERDAHEHHHREHRRELHGSLPPRGIRRQHDKGCRRERGVDDEQQEVAEAQARRGAHRIARAHDPVDDPRLASDLGRDPSRLERHDRRGSGQRARPR